MASAFSLIHSGARPTAGMSLMSSPRPPSVAICDRTVRMRLLSTQEPRCSTGGMPMVSQISRRPGPTSIEPRLAEEVAVLAGGDGAAARGDDQDVVLQELGDDVHVRLVLRQAGVVAAHVGRDAAEAAGRDGLVQRPEGLRGTCRRACSSGTHG